MRVPWTARRSNQSILKEINPEYSWEGLMLKLQYFSHQLTPSSQLIGKDLDAGNDWGQQENRVTEDKMVGWHHRYNGHELGQTLGDGEGHRSLACCSPWGHKESDTTRQLKNNNDSPKATQLVRSGVETPSQGTWPLSPLFTFQP